MQYIKIARRAIRNAAPPTEMPIIAPVVRTGELEATGGALDVEEEAEVEEELEVVLEVGEAEVADVEVWEDVCLRLWVSTQCRGNIYRGENWGNRHTEEEVVDGGAVIVAAR